MPKSPLDDLPPADPKAFRKAIKLNLVRALQSLATFSDSVRAGRTPDWPPAATYALFMAQLRAFRLISKRKENAPALQLMREIDHSWRGLKVVRTVDLCIAQLQSYMGNSLLGSANAKAQFERQNDPAKDRRMNPSDPSLQSLLLRVSAAIQQQPIPERRVGDRGGRA
jgi:hypothetical protein